MTQKDYTATISAKITAKEAIDRISRVPDWWTKGFTGSFAETRRYLHRSVRRDLRGFPSDRSHSRETNRVASDRLQPALHTQQEGVEQNSCREGRFH